MSSNFLSLRKTRNLASKASKYIVGEQLHPRNSSKREQSLETYARSNTSATSRDLRLRLDPNAETAGISQFDDDGTTAQIIIPTRELDNPFSQIEDEKFHQLVQYASTLHETGHYNYSDQASMEERLESLQEYLRQEAPQHERSLIKLAKKVWNAIEDGAIEEAIRNEKGANATQKIAVKNETFIAQSVKNVPGDVRQNVTLESAIRTAAMDLAKYDTGVLRRLLDDEDESWAFKSEEHAEAFDEILPGLRQAVQDALTTPNAVGRTHETFDYIDELIKELIELYDDSDELEPSPSPQMQFGDPDDTDNDFGSPQQQQSQGLQQNSDKEIAQKHANITQQSVSMQSSSQSDEDDDDSESGQSGGAGEQSNGEEQDDSSNDGDGDGDETSGDDDESDTDQSGSGGDDDSQEEDGDVEQSTGDGDANEEEETEEEDTAGVGGNNEEETDDGEQGEQENDTTDSSESGDESDDEEGPGSQSSLFNYEDEKESEEGNGENDDTDDGESSEDSVNDEDTDGDGDGNDGESNDESETQESTDDSGDKQDDDQGEEQDGDEQTVEPNEDPDDKNDDLEIDSDLDNRMEQNLSQERRELNQMANQAQQELEMLSQAMEKDSGNKPLRNVEYNVNPSMNTDPRRWDQATKGQKSILANLEKKLLQSRRDSWKRGKQSGRPDSTRLHGIKTKNLSVMKQRERGDKKKYSVVVVLDRSGSMGGDDIEIAEEAVVKYALALEALKINVCVIDMYDNNARIVSPFGVDVSNAKGELLTTQTAGTTPLSDALEVARNRVMMENYEPIMVVVTDGRPDNPDKYQQTIQKTTMPVMGITIDRRKGNVPQYERTGSHEQYYDCHTYVASRSELEQQLEQLTLQIRF